MKIRRILAIVSTMMLLVGSACASSGAAEQGDESATTRSQAVEESDAEEADEQSEKRADAGEPSGQKSADRDKKKAKKKKMAGMCPMQVDGTTTSVEKLDGAVAMDFTTTGDVDELRSRVGKMAEMHNKHHGGKGQKHGKMKKKHGHKGKKGKKGKKAEKHGKMKKMKKMMAGTTAEAQKIEGGMRMKLTPEDADKLGELHKHMKKHSEKMAQKEGCPRKMMKGKKAKKDDGNPDS